MFFVLSACGSPTDNLLIGAGKGDTVQVKRALKNGAGVNKKDENGKTALMLASQWGHAGVVKLLLEAGAWVNETAGYDTDNALTLAIKNNHEEVIKLLLEAKADVNAKLYYDYTALMVAALEGRAFMVELLLESGADVNAKNKDGKTALMLAANRFVAEILKAKAKERKK